MHFQEHGKLTITGRIPAGKSYYKHQDTNQSYCSLDCLNDHMIYTHTITLETSDGEESTEEQDNDE